MAKHKRPSRPPAQKKPPLTHFLCLPLVTPSSKAQLEASVSKFKDDVTPSGSGLRTEDAESGQDDEEVVMPSVHPRAVRPVGALHCTLGVMSLKEDELKTAVDLLKGLDIQGLLRGNTSASNSSTAIDQTQTEGEASKEPISTQRPITPPQMERFGSPLTVDLKGLETMHAPHKTSILYISPSDASERLYQFCLGLQKTFKENDLLVEDNRALKLHATIVNTIYAKGRKLPQRNRQAGSSGAAGKAADDRSTGHGPNANAPLKIDATQILEKYKDYVWAENAVLDRVAICEMGAKKILDEQGNVKAEEYTEVASVTLPT